MNAVSPFIEEAAKIAASQKMSPVPKVRRGKTPLGLQKLIDSSQKPSEKLAGWLFKKPKLDPSPYSHQEVLHSLKHDPDGEHTDYDYDMAMARHKHLMKTDPEYANPGRSKTAMHPLVTEGLVGAGTGATIGALSALRKPSEKLADARLLLPAAVHGVIGAGRVAHAAGKGSRVAGAVSGGLAGAIGGGLGAAVGGGLGWLAGGQVGHSDAGTLLGGLAGATYGGDLVVGDVVKEVKKNREKTVKRLLKEAGIGVNSWARLAHENKAPGAKTRTPLRRLGRAIVTSPRAQGAAVGLAAGAYGVHKVKQMLDQHQENRQRQQQMQQQAAMAHYQKQAAATAYEKILKATESTRPYALSAGAGGATGLGAHEFLRGEEPATLKGRLLWGGIGAGAGLIDRKLREDAKKRGLAKEAFASAVDGRMNGMAGVKRPQFPTKGSTAVQMKQLNSLQTPNPKPTPTNNQQAAVPRPSNVIPG